MNNPTNIKEIKFIASKLQKKSPGLEDSSGEFYQTYKLKLKPILYNLSNSSRKEKKTEHVPIHFMRPMLPFSFMTTLKPMHECSYYHYMKQLEETSRKLY